MSITSLAITPAFSSDAVYSARGFEYTCDYEGQQDLPQVQVEPLKEIWQKRPGLIVDGRVGFEPPTKWRILPQTPFFSLEWR